MIAQIVAGSKAIFNLKLRDNNGDPVSLADFVSGTLRFRNCAGDIKNFTLDVPGTHPDAGIIAVELPATDTEDADKGWRDADLILTASDPDDSVIIPLPDSFQILQPEVVVP